MKYLAKYRGGEVIYEEKDGQVLVDKRQHAPESHFIIGEIEAYESPVDGRVISSRAQRRADLDRTDSRPWEGREQESKEAKRREGYIEQKNDAQLHETVSRAYYQLSPSKRDALRR